MPTGNASPQKVPRRTDQSFLSGPDDPIWDDIFDWIIYTIQPFSSIVAYSLAAMKGTFETYTNTFISQATSQMAVGFGTMNTRLLYLEADIAQIKATEKEILKGQVPVDWGYLTGILGQIPGQLASTGTSIFSQLTRQNEDVKQHVDQALESQKWEFYFGIESLRPDINQISPHLQNVLMNFTTDMEARADTNITYISEQINRSSDGIIEWIGDHVVDPIAGWWGSFIDRLFDFGAWIGNFLEAIWNWLSRDVPGHSPWYETALKEIGKVVWGVLIGAPLDIINFAVKSFTFGLTQVLAPIGEVFNQIVTVFMEGIETFVGALGPTNPDIAPSSARSLTSVGMTAIVGLAGMTLASSWLKPLGGAGMGQIAAMIYDMTNFKVITGASVTALAYAAIRTPMTYHFNNLFRPYLLQERDFVQLLSRKAFSDPEPLQNPELTAAVRALPGGGGPGWELQYLGYRGYPSQYYGFYKELANTPLRYFPLAGIARTGFFEKTWFTEALHRSGYSKTAIDALMVMYKKMVDETLQGTMSSVAITRFKEGFTDEAQFHAEMELLGYSDDQFAKYLVAARISYATDYLVDLVGAYRDAVRKGNLSIEEYRTQLLSLGLVPERVEAYVLKEKARLKPEEALTPLGLPKPIYGTDYGKIQVDTIRRQRRKELISPAQEYAGLTALGMPVELAEATVANDDVRLAEKGGED
jgi:hypothetical protein